MIKWTNEKNLKVEQEREVGEREKKLSRSVDVDVGVGVVVDVDVRLKSIKRDEGERKECRLGLQHENNDHYCNK
jgi:hypothetical protein